MLQGNTTIHPPMLRPAEMAELLAAIVAHEAEVAALVARLAPRHAVAMLDELARLGEGHLSPERISHALRWILPEIHEEFAGACRAALA